jgi:FkbM family methyltransferase
MVPLGSHIPDIVRRELEGGTYEGAELDALDLGLTNDDIVMELGTGLGVLSAVCAQRIGSDRVYTFEADPELKPHIERLYRANQVSPELNMCMLSNHSDPVSFYRVNDFRYSSSLPIPEATVVTVPIRLFEDELSRISPTMLIIDIEGGEYDLLVGANSKLDSVERVLIEVHAERLGSEKYIQLLDYFRQSGFRITKSRLDALRRLFYELAEYFGVAGVVNMRQGLAKLGFIENPLPLLQEVLLFCR